MLNDIFAASMEGRFQTEKEGRLVEEGRWSYRGHGNAEITMTAEAERPGKGARYETRLHSVERQVDEFYLKASRDDARGHDLRAIVAGHTLSVNAHEADGIVVEGTIGVPDETVYDGPSPIWMIHMMMTAPPPDDREVTTPFVRLDAESGEFRQGFFRVSRKGPTVRLLELDQEGVEHDLHVVSLAEDGCPRRIQSGTAEIEILRTPRAVGV